jgi:hypothetical protein
MKVYTGSAWVDAYVPGSTYLAKASNLSDLTNTATARTNLGVAIGTDVQAYDADLTTIAGLTPTNNYAIIGNGTSWTSSALPSSVTSVTGTSPVVSSGGTTPAISMPAATGSVNGYLTSTDWTTFNNKQAAGSYVTVGGALGTPSSGTLTNTTGLPIGGITATGTPSASTFLRGDGSWASVSASSANNLSGGALGSVPYQLLSGTTTFLAGNTTTTPQFITSTGVAGLATAPTLTGSTGSGNVVLATSPTLVTPTLGSASATQLATALGSAGAPALTFTGDTNTGIFSPAADTIAFAEGGVESMRINSTGQVGIGTSSPPQLLSLYADGVTLSPLVNFDRGGVVTGYCGTDGAGAIFGSTSNHITRFMTNGTEKMRIANGGDVGIGTTSPAGKLDVRGSGYFIGNGSTVTTFLGTSATIGDGSGYCQWNTSVNSFIVGSYTNHPTYFVTNNTERMRITAAGDVQLSTANTSILNSSGRKILNQTGSILQVISVSKTDTFSSTSTSFADITGLSVTITPSSTSSRIMVICETTITAGGGSGGFYGVRLVRNSTAIDVGDAAGSRVQASYGSRTQSDDNMTKTGAFNVVDSPATTSATTYKLQSIIYSGGTIYINRQLTDSDNNGYGRFASTITVMEIAG